MVDTVTKQGFDIWEEYKKAQIVQENYEKSLEEEEGEEGESDSDFEMDDESCNSCGASFAYFVKKDGYVTCTECGTVQKSIISEEAEWNNYRSSDGGAGVNKSRTANSYNDINPFIDSMSTFMPKGLKSTYITKEGKKIEFDISRLHIQSSYNHRQKSFDLVKNEIENVMTKNYHKNIIETTEMFWAEIMKASKVTRGRKRRGLIACCLYYSCLYHNCTKSPLTMCQEFGMTDTKEFIKGDKEFKEVFENHPKWGQLLTKTSDSQSFLNVFCTNLDVGFNIRKQSTAMCEKYRKKLTNVMPKSAAAGILLYICQSNGISITKSKMRDSTDVCIPTLTKIFNIISKAENRENRKTKPKKP